MNFIQANDKFINLDHVSSITLLKDRIAFDLDCQVELDSGKIISYYAYHDYNIIQENYDILNNTIIQKNFLRHRDVLINVTHISSIKFIDNSNRIIFNLSHSITSTNYKKDLRLTSKFIYFDCNNGSEYSALTNIIINRTGIRK